MKRTYFAWTVASVSALTVCLHTALTVSCRFLQDLPAKISFCSYMTNHVFNKFWYFSPCMFQIRRYVYNDVLRVDDAQKLFDSAFVQVSNKSGYEHDQIQET